jgi:hypothetical protein
LLVVGATSFIGDFTVTVLVVAFLDVQAAAAAATASAAAALEIWIVRRLLTPVE